MDKSAEKLLMAFINDAYQGSGKPKKSTALAMMQFVARTEGLQRLVNSGDEKAIKAFKLPTDELETQRDQLLEALEMVIADKAPGYHDCVDDGEAECAWCIARKAIAAARGEQ